MQVKPYPLDIDSFVDYCERHAIEYVLNEELHQVALPRPQSEGWAVRFVARPERGLATLAYPLPGEVPMARREEMAKAANLLNARTFLGSWVLNTSAGELYFRQSIGTEGVLFDDHGLRTMLQLVVGTVEVTVAGLERVLNGEPAEAVLAAES